MFTWARYWTIVSKGQDCGGQLDVDMCRGAGKGLSGFGQVDWELLLLRGAESVTILLLRHAPSSLSFQGCVQARAVAASASVAIEGGSSRRDYMVLCCF